MTDLHTRMGALTALTISAISALSGCGLISSDVTNFNLDLPEKRFSIDASSWDVDNVQADAYLRSACTSTAMCDAAAQLACAMDCNGVCNTATSTCDLTLQVGLHQAINLVMEKPELQSINDEPIIKVTIDAVTYQVTMNSLTVDTPPLDMYVAPMSVMDPTDPEAKKIGTIAAVSAGATTTNQPIAFTAEGKAHLVTIMSTYKTPFNVIVGAAMTVRAGDSIPSGKLDAVINIRAHAGL